MIVQTTEVIEVSSDTTSRKRIWKPRCLVKACDLHSQNHWIPIMHKTFIYNYSVLPSILEAGNYLTWPTFKKKLFQNCMRMLKTWVPIPFIGFLYLQDIRGRRQLKKPWFWKGMLKRFLQPLSLREARGSGRVAPITTWVVLHAYSYAHKRTCTMYISNNMYSLYQVHDLLKVVHQFSMFTPSSLPWMSGLWSRNASNKGAAIWAICNLQSDEPSTSLNASDIQSPQPILLHVTFFPIQIPNHLDFSFKVNKSIWGSMITGQELGTKCVSMDSNPILWVVTIW